jgi:hypothetical protein
MATSPSSAANRDDPWPVAARDGAAARYAITALEPNFSPRRICRLRHNYHEHPLLQLDRLEQLAHALQPTDQCRFLAPGTTDASRFVHKRKTADGRSLDEVFRQLHEPGSWIALYNVQTDPTYGPFLRDAVANVRGFSAGETPVDVRGFIFISAPPSVTPFHIDRENNFWLQIRGRKTLSVWDRMDRETVAARDVDSFIQYGDLSGVRLTDEARSRAINFDCGPGDGVSFPSTSPHMSHTEPSWVTPRDFVVISIGVVFYSAVTRRNAYVHAANGALRRLGLDPDVAGVSEWADRAKYPLGRVAVAVRRRLMGYKPPPGFDLPVA